jgi:hypothetical protein
MKNFPVASIYDNSIGGLCFSFSFDYELSLKPKATHRCWKCPSSPLDLKRPLDLVRHMAPHIIYDSEELGAFPCGFCLGSTCKIFISKRRGAQGKLFINTEASTCDNVSSLSLQERKKKNTSKDRPPITNKPIVCPACGMAAPAVWNYNLKSHLQQVHKMEGSQLGAYKHLYHISKEELTEVAKLNDKLKHSRTTSRKLQQVSGVSISEPHIIHVPSNRFVLVAFRYRDILF